MKWKNWLDTQPKYIINREDTYLMLSIPTIDQIRMNAITKSLMLNGMHALLIGPTGTGKSLSINKLIKAEFDNESWTPFQIGFSA